ncbi:hypothetical protein V6C42_07775 [Pseudoclostridium thermosuccinogenes]
MGKILFEVVVSVLAIYGAITLASQIINSIRCGKYRKNPGIKLILAVKNQEDVIEGIIRGIYRAGLLEKAMCSGHLTVLDMGSKDDTVKILMKLKKYYQDFDIAEAGDINAILESFSNKDPEEVSRTAKNL